MNIQKFKSRKEVTVALAEKGINTSSWSEVDWLKLNTGQAEIHMMALAEAMWDAMNESTPKQLQAGEWHIPFNDKMYSMILEQFTTQDLYESELEGTDGDVYSTMYKVKISTAMAARTSYTVVGDEKEVSYETLLNIHDKMAIAKPFHASPFEHNSIVPTQEEYDKALKGIEKGWFRNFHGFKQYRHILENNNII